MTTPWPGHPKPIPGELLSSWIARLALENFQGYCDFCRLAWPENHFGLLDIDRLEDPKIFSTLVEKTGASPAETYQASLLPWEGVLSENLFARDWFRSGILPLGNIQKGVVFPGIQYCPACLVEDREPYFRRAWRLVFLTICPQHHLLLRNHCPRCQYPVNWYQLQSQHNSLAHCTQCGFNLRLANTSRPQNLRHHLRVQNSLWVCLQTGWGQIRHSGVPAPLYFAGFFALMEFLCRIYIARPREVRVPTVEERIFLLGKTASMLATWPTGFLHFCKQHHLFSAQVLLGLHSIPYWLWRPVHDHLFQPYYKPSDEEIRSVIWWLEKSHKPITNKNIAHTLGLTSSLLYKRNTSIKDLLQDFKTFSYCLLYPPPPDPLAESPPKPTPPGIKTRTPFKKKPRRKP